MDTDASSTIDQIYRTESPRVLATLVRLLGNFDLAEDAMHEAFATAAVQWQRDGVPSNPVSWLISTGRFKAIDAMRRETRLFVSLNAVHEQLDHDPFPTFFEHEIEDDRLRLIFACCHPSLSNESQIALTLRHVCGLSTEEIGSAFLTSTPTIAQRIVRAKARLREEKVTFELPSVEELEPRLEAVLRIAYLLFNEGYYASSGENLTKSSLSDEAIRLGRLLTQLLPHPETFGLLSLMLLNESRRAARTSPDGDIVLLADQNRSLWNVGMIEEGLSMVELATNQGVSGFYGLQAQLAKQHVSEETDWLAIIELYDRLLLLNPSPVAELNRAVAVSKAYGPSQGLTLVDRLLKAKSLDGYSLAYATKADFHRQMGDFQEAGEAYRQALDLTTQSAERRFLEGRLLEVSTVRQ